VSHEAVAAPASVIDQHVPWHYGNPHAEQRALVAGTAVVDISNRAIVRVCGEDRISWLNTLTTQYLLDLAPVGSGAPGAASSALALVLSPNGHVEHELHVVDDGTCTWIVTEPDSAPALLDYLTRMQFWNQVTITDVTDAFAVVWEPSREPDPVHPSWLVPTDFAERGFAGREVILPRSELPGRLSAAPQLAGTWALEALRAAAGVPRAGRETDHRTIPHEVGWIQTAVHLNKGCYRGQETVARVHNLGRPPRRLVLLHLDGSTEAGAAHCDRVFADDVEVGWVGTGARHFELGAIATAIIKRSIPDDARLTVRTADGPLSAAIEPIMLQDR